MPRQETKEIIVHCAATRPDQDIDAKEIDRWHRQRGWSGIGYHFVIKRDGTIETGRDIEATGAHARGHNWSSVGICMVGGLSATSKPFASFTDIQYVMLRLLVDGLKARYPAARLIGHNDVSSKDCPCFDVGEWYDREIK